MQQKTAVSPLDNFLYKTVCINVQASVIVNLSGSGVSPVNSFLLLGDENLAMKFGVRFCFCFALTEFAVNVDNLISTILNQNSINGL